MPSDRMNPIRMGWLLTAAVLAFLVLPTTLSAQQIPEIRIVKDARGQKLQVDGEDFMVLGMNWDYFPVGTTTTYSFWDQSDEFIEAALANEMSYLQNMGVNAIRVYIGIPQKWITHIWERYGIWTILNDPVGRYGVTLNGAYIPNTDYSDPAVREHLKGVWRELVPAYKDTPGLLMWLLGNENNYGLVWSSAETEDLPTGEADAVRARYLYSLMGEITDEIHAMDPNHPVAMANGDLQYLDIIAEEMPGLDVFGSNVYRGISFRDFFDRVDEAMGIPVMFTEFGADAFNARTFQEDQATQAKYLLANWKEIYEQSYGKGLVGNSIGGLTFQWTDGWWKYLQDERLDVHDINASWANDAYPEDYVPGQNNMNEEWWGIAAKGRPDEEGFYPIYPRMAYYALKQAYELDPYGPNTTLAAIDEHWRRINPQAAALVMGGGAAVSSGGQASPVRLSEFRADIRTYNTGGSNLSTPDAPEPGVETRPTFKGFDHLQSFFLGAAYEPKPNLSANVTVNILGNVPDNPIDEIFYENRGRAQVLNSPSGETEVQDFERVAVYQAGVSWEDRRFRLDAFYRTGHYHWGYEGDFFNFYREANYGPNIDIYNGQAPIGVEFTGKGGLDGLAVAFGPELWWGANPAVLARYTRSLGNYTFTGVFQEDVAQLSGLTASFAVPLPENRRASLHMTTTRGAWTLDLGGLWAGSKLVGREYQVAEGGPGNYTVRQGEIEDGDTWGGKAKLSYQKGRVNWYLQGAAMGLVASGGGFDQTQTFTGYTLKDSGSGNQYHVLTGLNLIFGDWQIGPNFLWQKPMVGPIPADVPAPGRPRNQIDDPFFVRANRETVAGEVILTFDPTPATWMYSWDSDEREDAPLAASLGFTFRHLPTTQDAAIGFLPDGRTPFAFPGAAPAEDLWEARARVISKRDPANGWILNLYGGPAQARGDSDRTINRVGGDLRFIMEGYKLTTFAKFNDWGPFDYHQDFNLTFPMQLMVDISKSFTTPSWWDLPNTRFGIMGTFRTLDEFSNRFCPGTVMDQFGMSECDPTLPGDNGQEWEIRTYLQIGM